MPTPIISPCRFYCSNMWASLRYPRLWKDKFAGDIPTDIACTWAPVVFEAVAWSYSSSIDAGNIGSPFWFTVTMASLSFLPSMSLDSILMLFKACRLSYLCEEVLYSALCLIGCGCWIIKRPCGVWRLIEDGRLRIFYYSLKSSELRFKIPFCNTGVS